LGFSFGQLAQVIVHPNENRSFGSHVPLLSGQRGVAALPKLALYTTGTIFALVCLLHVARYIFEIEIIGGRVYPPDESLALAVLSAVLAV
jgi:hypothetical protein